MSEEEIKQEFEIIERSRADPAAFSELYNKYFDRIFSFIYRQTDDEDVAADICSQTFFNALKALDRFTFRGVPVSAWFYRIAGNEVNKYYRKVKREKVFSIEETRVRELMAITEDSPEQEELIHRLVDYLKELPVEMLEVLQLRFFEDHDFREIAYILNITESGAKMRTYRALDRLRKNFNLQIRYDGKK